VDQDRDPAPLLRRTLDDRGFHFTTEVLLAAVGEEGTLGTMYTIHPPSAG
jgi:hypothetical protein